MNQGVWCIRWTEHESGWGQKPFNQEAYATKEAAEERMMINEPWTETAVVCTSECAEGPVTFHQLVFPAAFPKTEPFPNFATWEGVGPKPERILIV